jgi:hypothetical protein
METHEYRDVTIAKLPGKMRGKNAIVTSRNKELE